MPQTSSCSEWELLQHLISEPLLIRLWKTTEQLLGDKKICKHGNWASVTGAGVPNTSSGVYWWTPNDLIYPDQDKTARHHSWNPQQQHSWMQQLHSHLWRSASFIHWNSLGVPQCPLRYKCIHRMCSVTWQLLFFVWTQCYNLSDIAQPFTLHIWINKRRVSLGAARLVKWIRKPWKYCLPSVHQLLDNYSRPSCKKNRWWVSISTVDFFALMQP